MRETRGHVEKEKQRHCSAHCSLPLGKWETVIVKTHSIDVSTISLYDEVNSTDICLFLCVS